VHGGKGRRAMNQPIFHALLFIDDVQLGTYAGYRGLAKTLRESARVLDGAANGEMCIWFKGRRAAWMKCNWRGELAEVEIYSPVSPLVTPMNPTADMFRKEGAL